MSIRGRGALLAALLAVVPGVSACGDGAADGGDGPDGGDAAGAWRTSGAPVETGGLVWAAEGDVHLADGTTVATGSEVEAYLVAGDGVFFVPGSEETDENGDDGSVGDPLHFVAPGEEPVDTGLRVGRDSFAVSPDGLHLVVLETDHDDGSGRIRVFDLATGQAATSEDGWDSGQYEDPVHQLSEMEVAILGVTDSEVHARTIEGDWTYDLTTGEGRPSDEEPTWGNDPTVSPDGTWRILQGRRWRDVLLTEGARVVPEVDAPRWTLSGWLDEDTVRGALVRGPGRGQELGPDDSVTLMTCEVPSGRCDPLPETTGRSTTRPVDTGYVHALPRTDEVGS